MELEAVSAWNAIAIEEDEVIAASFQNGLVADGTLAEPLIGVPHVANREGCAGGKRSDDCSRFGSAAVVGNEKLEVMK
jgi:hypothetical protein